MEQLQYFMVCSANIGMRLRRAGAPMPRIDRRSIISAMVRKAKAGLRALSRA